MNLIRSGVLRLSLVACCASIFAAVGETVNDLAPFDNQVSTGDYWNTTGHVPTEVNRTSMTLSSALDARPANVVEKDVVAGEAGARTWFDALFDLFRCTRPSGFLFFFR